MIVMSLELVVRLWLAEIVGSRLRLWYLCLYLCLGSRQQGEIATRCRGTGIGECVVGLVIGRVGVEFWARIKAG